MRTRDTPYRAVLFDLDGTLVDTAPDLAFALNEMLRRRGKPALARELTRPQASHGTRGLLRVGFEREPGHPDFDGLRQEFLGIYERNLTQSSLLFPGISEVLVALEAARTPWGVVTNKPSRYTEPLLNQLGLFERAACVVSGDTCPEPKPHPGPLLRACETMDLLPGDCLYVGDAARDIQAARAARMDAVVALYGYIGVDDRPGEWGANGFIDHPSELLNLLSR